MMGSYSEKVRQRLRSGVFAPLALLMLSAAALMTPWLASAPQRLDRSSLEGHHARAAAIPFGEFERGSVNRVAGRIVCADGASVDGAHVAVFSMRDVANWSVDDDPSYGPLAMATSGPDGEFSFSDLPFGPLAVTARRADASFGQALDIGHMDGYQQVDIRVQVESTPEQEFVVQDAEQVPLAHETFLVISTAVDRPMQSVRSDERGVVRLGGLMPDAAPVLVHSELGVLEPIDEHGRYGPGEDLAEACDLSRLRVMSPDGPVQGATVAVASRSTLSDVGVAHDPTEVFRFSRALRDVGTTGPDGMLADSEPIRADPNGWIVVESPGLSTWIAPIRSLDGSKRVELSRGTVFRVRTRVARRPVRIESGEPTFVQRGRTDAYGEAGAIVAPGPAVVWGMDSEGEPWLPDGRWCSAEIAAEPLLLTRALERSGSIRCVYGFAHGRGAPLSDVRIELGTDLATRFAESSTEGFFRVVIPDGVEPRLRARGMHGPRKFAAEIRLRGAFEPMGRDDVRADVEVTGATLSVVGPVPGERRGIAFESADGDTRWYMEFHRSGEGPPTTLLPPPGRYAVRMSSSLVDSVGSAADLEIQSEPSIPLQLVWDADASRLTTR